MRALVAEDNELVAELVRAEFTNAGWETELAFTGADARRRLRAKRFDVVILDIELPDADGLNILSEVRAAPGYTPVILLTARSGPDAVVKGLTLGADDYVAKPFSAAELIARVLTVVRRASTTPPQVLHQDDLHFNRLTRETTCNGRRIRLTPKEQALLEALMLNAGSPISREDLLQKVWRINFDPGSNLLNAHVARLRAKLLAAGSSVEIHARKGVGFAIESNSVRGP